MEPGREPCNDCRKGLLAERVQAQTTVKLDGMLEQLTTGDQSHCGRLIRKRAGADFRGDGLAGDAGKVFDNA
jgi:hypothetical protein